MHTYFTSTFIDTVNSHSYSIAIHIIVIDNIGDTYNKVSKIQVQFSNTRPFQASSTVMCSGFTHTESPHLAAMRPTRVLAALSQTKFQEVMMYMPRLQRVSMTLVRR